MSSMANDKKIYPFTAIVGQEDLKTALILNAVNPGLSGVLIRGEKGTAKSTAVRSLALILPVIEVVRNCPFQCHPTDPALMCPECGEKAARGEKLESESRQVRVIELPISATEDRVVGTMDLEHALKKGEKRIEPGLLAAANRGILYIDEVNLLDDHVVDVLLDSAAMGVNTIEREGISFTHAARFILVGTMNPEEGELRPQLLDRFGLCVQISGLQDPKQRMEIMVRRGKFDEDPDGFMASTREESEALRQRIARAQELYPEVETDEDTLMRIVKIALDVGVDGHRGDVVILKAAKTLAALEGRAKVRESDVIRAARLALPHRVRRKPFQEVRDLERTLENLGMNNA